MLLSQHFSKAAAKVSKSEFDSMHFDNEVAEGITHLDVSPNLFHEIDFSSLARFSHTLLPVLVTITSESADNNGDKDLGISDDWIAGFLPFRHALVTACGNRHFQTILKSQFPSLSPRHGLLRSILQSNFD